MLCSRRYVFGKRGFLGFDTTWIRMFQGGKAGLSYNFDFVLHGERKREESNGRRRGYYKERRPTGHRATNARG